MSNICADDDYGNYFNRFVCSGWKSAQFTVEDAGSLPLADRRIILFCKSPLTALGVRISDENGIVTFSNLADIPNNLFVVAFGESQTESSDISDTSLTLTPMTTLF